jgi:hypothetical protein
MREITMLRPSGPLATVHQLRPRGATAPALLPAARIAMGPNARGAEVVDLERVRRRSGRFARLHPILPPEDDAA